MVRYLFLTVANEKWQVWRHGSRALFIAHRAFQKGIQEQRLLGEFLQQRYKEFMTNYSTETIYVRSSDSNRTIMSGLATISGFIPPSALSMNGDAFSAYQTIPIHRTPLKHDRVGYFYYSFNFVKRSVIFHPCFRHFVMEYAPLKRFILWLICSFSTDIQPTEHDATLHFEKKLI
ncbi:His Phos 2 domain containing protein [Trichuris trichiura]|uniref:His Phos 2 domain containing protein n=1 Tax=Trichuris trichiura TaxID=36087 RepID=A0A077ZNV5_TRITR|nr:His Phos 2 domain containing protein [Trichuris trichiura]